MTLSIIKIFVSFFLITNRIIEHGCLSSKTTCYLSPLHIYTERQGLYKDVGGHITYHNIEQNIFRFIGKKNGDRPRNNEILFAVYVNIGPGKISNIEILLGFLYNYFIMNRKTYNYTVWFCFFWLLVVHLQGVPLETQAQEEDILKVRGIKVTGGAAPGYVEDRVCAMCHSQKYRSYQEVGMAKAFFLPRADKFIENFKADPFYHEPSKRYYQISQQGDQLFFKRYQLDEKKQPINVFSVKIDWIMGSGNHSRVYIFRTASGELYQLPLAWYSQTNSWGMAPGFDRPAHMGLSRQVRHECMFCHNAYPDIPEGRDDYLAPHELPEELPKGTGCQRCHGPGANHVRIVFSGQLDPDKIHATIINPARLKPELRNDICFQCHLQPSVVLFGVRRFDRAIYSFRPGQRLSDYLVHMDVKEEGKEQIERFEINHHPYRLMQSRCFKESQGTMSCLTCHDPHRKVAAEQKEEHYRKACLQCHKIEHCSRETHAGAGAGDCASCHMPERRTQDVVRVVMTDHLIQRQPPPKEQRLAPLKERTPIIVDAMFLDPAHAPPGDMGELYRVIAVFRAGGGANVLNHLETMMAKLKPQELVPYLDLARGQLNYRRFAEAEKNLNFILNKNPHHEKAKAWLAIALSGVKQLNKAIETLQKYVTDDKPGPEALYNLGRLLLASGQNSAAVKYLKQAVEMRQNLVPAWYQLGNAQEKLNLQEEAIRSYKRALEIDPTHTRTYLALGHLLMKTGNRTEALRYWRHGVKTAVNPEPIIKILAQYEKSQ